MSRVNAPLSKSELNTRRAALKAQRLKVTADAAQARAQKIRDVAAQEKVSSARAAMIVDGLIKPKPAS